MFNDPKRTSRALIALGGILLALCAKFGVGTETPLPIIGGYVGFVMLVRGLWLGWKYRKS